MPCGLTDTALESQALLNESVGAGPIERNWLPALEESGARPLASLQQSSLKGSLTRLLGPDTILRSKIVEFVKGGDVGYASGQKAIGSFERAFDETIRRMSLSNRASFCSRRAKRSRSRPRRSQRQVADRVQNLLQSLTNRLVRAPDWNLRQSRCQAQPQRRS